jgi:AhpD family alkylhydroperoxidase
MEEAMASPRIQPLREEQRSWFVRLVRWFARRRFGVIPAPLTVYEHSSPFLFAAGSFELGFERAHALDRKLKGLVNLKVAARVGCPFCLDIGSALAQGDGVTERQVRELHKHGESSAFSPLEREVLDFAVAMSDTPVAIADDTFSRLREALGEQAMVELCAVVAWENFRARMNHALGIKAQGFSENGVCALPEGADESPQKLAALARA